MSMNFVKNFFKWLNVGRLDIDSVQVTATADEINKLAGNAVVAADLTKLHAITAGANEINVLDGAANGAATFVIGAEAGNVINVAIQLRDPTPADIAMRQCVLAYLSADANGDALAAAPDGGVVVGTDGLLLPIVAGQIFHLVSEADGDIDLNLTHAGGAKTCYLVIVHPSGKLTVSGAITFAA